MKVDFYKTTSGRSPIEDFIKGLSAADQARFADVYYGIKEHGLECPRVIFKPISGKLWEIKFSSEGGKYRILYVVVVGDRMIWLHAFKKKTQKTPQNDLETAEKRLREVIR
ncbi:MAG TPA: type II toxin-antitoxin system RelE/ParE family toxin [bacterium]|nr:type II toxin-antitoxin system RelE/ParE family toxin [bacterium]